MAFHPRRDCLTIPPVTRRHLTKARTSEVSEPGERSGARGPRERPIGDPRAKPWTRERVCAGDQTTAAGGDGRVDRGGRGGELGMTGAVHAAEDIPGRLSPERRAARAGAEPNAGPTSCASLTVRPTSIHVRHDSRSRAGGAHRRLGRVTRRAVDVRTLCEWQVVGQRDEIGSCGTGCAPGRGRAGATRRIIG